MSDLASRPFRIESFDDSIGFDNRRHFFDPPLNSGILQKGLKERTAVAQPNGPYAVPWLVAGRC